MRISIMQPYFIPYGGYFRLFHEVDLFIIYDDVQLSKPGFVYRNQLTNRRGELEWLSIPLKTKPLSTDIKDIEFAESISERWQKARSRFKVFDQRPLPFLTQNVALMTVHKTPIEFLIDTMNITLDILKIKCPMVKSSRYKWSMFNHGQERVIEMCKKFKATEYVNASGGANLYNRKDFEEAGIKLKILKPYVGSKVSILERLAYEDRHAVREEIVGQNEFISGT